MTAVPTRRTARRWPAAATAVSILLATLFTGGTAAATPDPGDEPLAPESISPREQAEVESAIAGDEIPGVDEIVHSDNMTHLANVPKSALRGTNSDLAFQGRSRMQEGRPAHPESRSRARVRALRSVTTSRSAASA